MTPLSPDEVNLLLGMSPDERLDAFLADRIARAFKASWERARARGDVLEGNGAESVEL